MADVTVTDERLAELRTRSENTRLRDRPFLHIGPGELASIVTELQSRRSSSAGGEERDTVAAENRAKAREILADYDAGNPLDVVGDGWLVRFAAHILMPLSSYRAKGGG